MIRYARATLVLLFGLVSSAVWASERKVVLLTSIDSPKFLWHHDSQWIANGLESEFSRAFARSGFRIEMLRQAGAWRLFQALHDPEVVAVFWTSHAASNASFSDAVGLDNAIVTHDGLDIKAVFQSVGSQLKYLAIIGCSAQAVVNQARSEGAYVGNPELKIVSFDHLIEADAGLNFALNESIDVIGNLDRSIYGPEESEYSADRSDGDWKFYRTPRIVAKSEFPAIPSAGEIAGNVAGSIKVTREFSGQLKEEKGELLITGPNGEFLGVLSPLQSGGSQSVLIEHAPEHIHVSAHSGSSVRNDFADLTMNSADGRVYTPLAVGGHIIGSDSELWLTPSDRRRF